MQKIDWILKRIPRQFVTYLFVGGTAYLFEMGILFLFSEVLHFSDVISVGMSFWLGALFAFMLQKIITFNNRTKAPKIVGKQLVIYGALLAWNYFFTLGVVAFFADTTSVFILRTIAIGVIVLWNFLIYRTFIFNEVKPRAKNKKALAAKALPWWSSFKSPYVVFGALVLLVTSVWWSVLGALVQRTNADQLIDSYLFQNIATFKGATFPGAHTFLLKWPLFIIERLFNYSPVVLIILTVLVSVATVAGLAYLLYRIDRRPKVIGTVFLALASVLLFIPAQPHAGGLLPVNFAMLTTRNIEYLFYILSLVCIIRAPSFRSKQLFLAVAVLALLISSDKLFMWLSLGGAGLMLAVYLIARRTQLVKLALHWLGATVIAAVVSTLFLWLIDAVGITNITGGASPYGFALTFKQLALGSVFAIAGLLTNFGANPVFDIGALKEVPKTLAHRLFSPILLPFLINIAIFISGAIAASIVFKRSLIPVPQKKTRKKKPEEKLPVATLLSVALLATTIAAIGIFVVTDHYYPVDSRYETIALFALSIGLVTYLRSKPLARMPVRNIALVLVAAITIGCVWSFSTAQQQSDALDGITDRNVKISEVIENHKTDLLVGDYWRVVPISQVNTSVVTRILPMGNCTTPLPNLVSEVWRRDFEHHSFTYLLSLDEGLTGYPVCSVEQVVGMYGRPNASALIAGTNENPTELLLFYDGGVSKNRTTIGLSKTGTILPTTPEHVKRIVDCADNITIMNIVAHEDDDLLFMNPDLQKNIDAKHCIRTVYVTAGDAGNGSQYWLGRERATEAAYEKMMGATEPFVWVQKTVKLSDHAYVSIASPRGHREISLVFMHLPDGNLEGQGYGVSGSESLMQLSSGKVASIQSVDGQSTYTSGELTQALTTLMDFYAPTAINTQASYNRGHVYNDHADHVGVGRYVDSAYQSYMNRDATPLTHYVGYPIRELPQNVFDADLERKTAAFLSYALYDGSVCQSKVMCDQTPTYNSYLQRQYTY